MKPNKKLAFTVKLICKITYPYIIVVGFLFIMLVSVVLVSRMYLQNNMEEKLETELEGASEAVYRTVMSYDKIGEVLAATAEIRQFARSDNPANYETAMLVPGIQANMKNVMDIANVRLQDLAVYFPDSESVITLTASYLGENACSSYFVSRFSDAITRETLWSLSENTGRYMEYIDQYGILIRRGMAADDNAFFVLLKFEWNNLLEADDGIILIGDSKNYVFIKGIDEEVSQELYVAILESINKSRVFSLDNQQYVARKSVFSIMDKEIVIGLPVRIDQIPMSAFYKIAVLALAVVILFSVFYAANLIRQLINPVRNLAEATYDETGKYDLNNILNAVKNDMKSLELQNAAMKEERNNLIPLGVGALLERIRDMQEQDKAIELSRRCLSLCGLGDGRKFIIVGIYRNDIESETENTAFITQELHEKWRPVNELLKNILFVDHVGVLATAGHYFMLLCSLGERESGDSVRIKLEQVTDECKSRYRTKLAYSRVYEATHAEQIPFMVKETLKEVSYLEFWGKEEFDDCTEKHGENSISLLKLNRNLINRLDSRDYEGARQAFDRLIDEGIPEDINMLLIAKSRIQGMVEMLIVAYGDQLDERFEDEYLQKMFNKLQKINNLQDFRKESESIFEKLIFACQMTDDRIAGASLAVKVREYIDRHYTENDIGLASVAEKFGVSKSYLSRLFKAAYGLGLLEYIQRKRVEAAKEILAKDSVSSAAVKVGFYDTQGFVRVFKKLEGITPGEYKTHHM